jgi:hypothetical protein
MAQRSRERLPDTWITMTTNAQGRFRPEMARAGFNEIVCAIDGADSASYEPYRVHGKFDLAWRFLTDFVAAGASSDHRIRVVWKYVIFEHNAFPETLLRAQQMALDATARALGCSPIRREPAATACRRQASPAESRRRLVAGSDCCLLELLSQRPKRKARVSSSEIRTG